MQLIGVGKRSRISLDEVGGSAEEWASIGDATTNDAWAIKKLVKRNKEVLDVRFPGLSWRYRNWVATRQVIQENRHSSKLAGLNIGLEDVAGEKYSMIGQASLWLGKLTCGEEVILEQGANIALWLDALTKIAASAAP